VATFELARNIFFKVAVAVLTGMCLAGQSAVLSEGTVPGGFGVNIHFGDKELTSHIELLKRAGFGWVRTDVDWATVEREPGIYDFSAIDPLIRSFHDAGIRVLAILAYTNLNYCQQGSAPITPLSRAAFARFAAAAAARYAGKGVVWEIYNEPNSGFWKPAPNAEQYVEMADEVTSAIRASDPGAVIVGPALGGPELVRDRSALTVKDTHFLASVLSSRAVRMWSAITIHPYQGDFGPPEHADEQLALTERLVQQALFSPSKLPVIFGEWGHSSYRSGVSEALQASYVIRSFLYATMHRMPFSIWYGWQDDGDKPDEVQDRFGLIRSGVLAGRSDAELLKPSYNAVSQLASLLRGYRYEGSERLEGGMVASVRFSKGRSRALAVWSLDDRTRNVLIKLDRGKWRLERLLGPRRVVAVDSQQVNAAFLVDSMPSLIFSPQAP
jgi:hypothetical protein